MAGNKKFIEALEILENERGIKKEIVLDALKEALEKSYKKNYLSPDSIVRVDIDPKTAKISLHEIKTVVEEVEDEDIELSLEEAQEINPNYKIGDVVENAVSPDIFGRLAAVQTKQILRQKIREAEKESLYNEFIDKKDEIITGIVDRVEDRFAIVNIGKTGAFLAANQQIPGEKLVEGQHLKVYVSEVDHGTKGTHIVVSRTEPGLVKRLFEMEVPEIYEGIVEIFSVSREAGERSKIAVYTKADDIDPIGSCVGPKGTRVKNIVEELHGEMIDIVEYSKDAATFISNALAPSNVINVSINEEDKSAFVVVPDNQLSLAIGKRGQNARLAARLTGWKIDIKSLSDAISEGLYSLEEVKHEEYKDIEEEMLAETTAEEVEAKEEVAEAVEEIVEESDLNEVVIEAMPNQDIVEEAVEEIIEEVPAAPVQETKKTVVEEDDEEDYYDDDYSKYDEEIDYDEFDKYYDED
ncbi:MAG: transcription termination factor NusA [Beduini sp.]|uniref:transcription termination factor NusA n=1 Tax=Beduini sp. TaxID=1922300 RepID=UPI0039903DE6